MVAMPKSIVEDALGVDPVWCDAPLSLFCPVGAELAVEAAAVVARDKVRVFDGTSAETKAGAGTSTSGNTTGRTQ